MSSSYDEMTRQQLIDRIAALEASRPDPAARERLLETPVLTGELIDRLNIGVMIHDRDARIHSWNTAACNLLGVTPDQLSGRVAYSTTWDVIDDKGRSFTHSDYPVVQAITSRKPVRQVMMGIRNPQRLERTWLLLDAIPHLDPGGEIDRVIVTFSDVTAQKRAEERQRILANATSMLASSLEVENTLQSVTAIVAPTIADWCSILLLETPEILRRVAISHADEVLSATITRLRQQRLSLGTLSDLGAVVLRTGVTELISELDDALLRQIALDADHYQVLRELGTASMIRAPLIARGTTLGLIICAYGRSSRRYAPEDLPLIEEIARTAALAIDNARLYQTTRRHLAELTAVQRTAQVINSSVPLDTMFHSIVEAIGAAFGYEKISIYLLEHGMLHLQAALGYDQVLTTISLDQGVSGRVARSGQAAFVRDAGHEAEFLYAMPGIQQCIIVPLRVGDGQVTGTLVVESTAQLLTEDDLTILQLVADQTSVAISNARLFAALRDSEQRYRAVIDQAADAILLTDPDWLVVDANLEASRLLGYSREQLLNIRIADLGEHGSRKRWPPNPGASFALRRCDGSNVQVEASIGTLTHQDQNQQIVILRDITERLRAEDLQRITDRRLIEAQNLESLGVMAGGIAHDFNNLLMAITGNTGLIGLELPPRSPLHENLAQIDEAARRAAELTQQLLAYAGKTRMFLRPIEITHLIDEVATLLQSIVGLNITIVERLSPSVPAILGDSAQIRRMLLNLITNAAEAIATVPGTITISTALRTIDSQTGTSRGLEIPPGEYVEIAVSDSGPGIDPALHRRIFEPFYTTKFTGRGLGLAVVQGIVRAHGGTLSIESSLGQGATFTIFLPTEPSARPAPTQPPTPPQSAPQTTPQAILVVDDEASVRQTIAQMLAQLGWRVKTAENAQSALAIIREQDSALAAVLLDLTMPDQSGADVYLEIRRLSPNLPVILISGYTAEEVDQRFGDQAPPPFLHKPFGLGVLRATLLRALAPDALRV